jgi:DNA-cytosine methyltransferase
MLTVGSLFSGIGGLDLGLEQAGMRTIWQVEYDDWARGKLEEIFPHTQKFKDVREVGKHNLRAVDLICGGFPCTDVSVSKRNRKGLDGDGSGLWFEMHRILCELRPKYALIENVANLLILDGHRVMSDLARSRFNAEWSVIRASEFGLPVHRKRIFIFAVAQSLRRVPSAVLKRAEYQDGNPREVRRRHDYSHLKDIGRSLIAIPEHLRMDDGVSFELSEIEAAIKGYGNAVAPPVARWIGERIIEFDGDKP